MLGPAHLLACPAHYLFIYLFLVFISPLFNQVGKLRTSSHLQLRPGQDKAKQFDTYNDIQSIIQYKQVYIRCEQMRCDKGGKGKKAMVAK